MATLTKHAKSSRLQRGREDPRKPNDYENLVALHSYGDDPAAVLKPTRQYMDECAAADQNAALVIVDDTGGSTAVKSQLKNYAEFYQIQCVYVNAAAQRIILAAAGSDISQYFKLPLYQNGRNKVLLVAEFLRAPRVHFFDLDTLPADTTTNIVDVHARLCTPEVPIVSAKYLPRNPSTLTCSFLEEGVRESFKRSVEQLSQLGPTQQRVVGGCFTVHESFFRKCVPPPIKMCVFADDAFLGNVCEMAGHKLAASLLHVAHEHDDRRVNPEWVFQYLAERMARSVTLQPLAEPMRPLIVSAVNQETCCCRPDAEAYASRGRFNAMDRLIKFADSIEELAPRARHGCRRALRFAAADIRCNAETRVDEVTEALIDYVSGYLSHWSRAMRKIRSIEGTVREEILNAIEIFPASRS